MITFLHPHFGYLRETIHDANIVRFESFSDGWPRIFLENKSILEGGDITYIGDFREVEDFFGQIAFLDGLARYHINMLHIVIPFFPAASMERDTPSGEFSIAHVFAKAFGIIGDQHPGRIHIHLYDIHDEREIFYFPSSLQIHHHTTTNILKKTISTESRKPTVLFPDAGAKKGFARFFEDYAIVTCAKIRKSPTEIEMVFEGGSLDDQEVIIVDDHIRSGGTLIEASRYARQNGARRVSSFAPHAVFAEGIRSDFLEAFDTFYTTDTIPINLERFSGNPKVQVLPFWQ